MKIGIFSGTFDPIHAGHLSFASEAISQVGVDQVWFLPEAKPRGKDTVTSPSHRHAMLQLALENNTVFKLVKLPETTFTLATSWPSLQRLAGHKELCLLVGSDVFKSVASWPDLAKFKPDFVVGMRKDSQQFELQNLAKKLKLTAKFLAHAADAHSSSKVRLGQETALPALANYIAQNNLYA